MCRVLAVSASGYYVWRQPAPSARARADAELTTRIRVIHQYSRGACGAPRIHQELMAADIHAWSRSHGLGSSARWFDPFPAGQIAP
jgi:putative transposase